MFASNTQGKNREIRIKVLGEMARIMKYRYVAIKKIKIEWKNQFKDYWVN